MKKAFLWLLALVLAPVVLFAVLAGLLYVPPVQNWAADRVAAIASEKTGMLISVDHVSLVFPLDLAIDGFRMLQPHDTASGTGSQPAGVDTIADVGRLVVDVRLRPLLRHRVVVDRMEAVDTRFNTNGFIDAAQVKGRFSRLALHSRGIDLDGQTALVNGARLEGARIEVVLADSVPPDTTVTQNLWVVRADSVSLVDADVAVRRAVDSLSIGARAGHLVVRDVLADLGAPCYRVGSIDWQDGAVSYNDVVSLPQLALHTGAVSFQNDSVNIPSLHLRTPESSLSLAVACPLSFADSVAPGQLRLDWDAQLGYADLSPLTSRLPKAMQDAWPRYPLTVKGGLAGSLDHLAFSSLDLSLPTAFALTADGTVDHATQPARLKADVRFKAHGQRLNFVMAALPADVRRNYRIPDGLQAEGRVGADGADYMADVTLRDGSGTLHLSGDLNADRMSYDIDAAVSNIDIHRFMPRDSIYTVTADVRARGQGTDLFAPQTTLDATAEVAQLHYGHLNLTSLTATATIDKGRLEAGLHSSNGLLNGSIGLGALMSKNRLDGTLTADIGQLDLQALGLVAQPFSISLCGHVDVDSDLLTSHSASGLLNDLTIRDSARVYRPGDIGLLVKTRPDTTYIRAQSGDLIVKLDAQGNYRQLLRQFTTLADTVAGQYADRVIDQPALRRLLPTVKVHLESRTDNPVATFLKSAKALEFKDLQMNLAMSPAAGINGEGSIHRLIASNIQLDTITFRLTQRAERLSFGAQVRNNKKNPDFVFNALFDGVLQERGATFGVRLYDAAQKLGVRLGAQAEMVDSGLRFHLVPERPTLGYKEYNLNSDNYVLLGRNNKAEARIDLVADDGMGLKVYTEDGDDTYMQDLTVSLNRFSLDEITAVLPYMPHMTGLLNGDYHVVQDADGHFSVAGDMDIRQMTYEHSLIGNVSTELVYLQKEEDAHALEARLMMDGEEVGLLTGTYYNGEHSTIDAKFLMERLPLSMVNGFVPDQLFGLQGYAEGELAIRGQTAAPMVNGEVYLNSSYLESIPYGVKLRFDDDPVRIVDSRLLLENFTVYAYNDNPLNIQGDVDFSRPDDGVTVNLRMRARNLQLIGAKENVKSVAYGKAFVNVFASMTGPADNLYMRGRLDVLGSTDVSYVLRDSPLTTDNQLQELVKFTDFADTAKVVVERPSLNGFQMDMTVDVSNGAHVMAYLNTDHSNYIDLLGGGTLRMQYTPTDGIQLRGRYTLSNGEMKYSLPVIPLKTFTIREGSYIEFTGDAMNPTLNINATERTKAAVTDESGAGRSVEFDSGVSITKTLNDMGLEFTLDAPEDMQLHSELQAMSVEQRGKLAVTMLTTGMYLGDGNTGALSMNAALSSFLSSEINQITGNALRSLDLSVGMDNSTDAAGNMHTDYSFKFSKRLLNNRLKIVIGGMVSSGAELQQRNNSFFDNVSLEYRLDDTANKFVTLFYQNNSYDWLDGYTQKYGGGFTWRRSLQTIWDIFRLKDASRPGGQPLRSGLPLKGQEGVMAVPTDSLNEKKHEEK